jgi:hypothetical protein
MSIPSELLFPKKEDDKMYKICNSIHEAVLDVKERLFENSNYAEELDKISLEIRKRLNKK